MVLRDCGESSPSIFWLLRASRQGWSLPIVSGDLNVTSCMTPKVRFLDGVVCVLLCVGLCRLHVVLHKMSKLPDLQKRCDLSHEGRD